MKDNRLISIMGNEIENKYENLIEGTPTYSSVGRYLIKNTPKYVNKSFVISSIRQVFLFRKHSKYPDLSCKTDLDFWDGFVSL